MPRVRYQYHAPNALYYAFPARLCSNAIQGSLDFGGGGNKIWQTDGTNGFRYLRFSKAEWKAAAWSTAVLPGPPSLNAIERRWRWNTFKVACRKGFYHVPAHYLARTPVQVLAETTEKAVLSYTVGSTFTAALAEGMSALHGAPSGFMHLNAFVANGGALAYRWDNRRPDYVSNLGGGGVYQLWEAKGSGGGLDNANHLTTGDNYGGATGMLTGAMVQLYNITQVGGVAPNARIGVMARGYNSGEWRMHVSDPGQTVDKSAAPEQQDLYFVALYRAWLAEFAARSKEVETVQAAGQSFRVLREGGEGAFGLDERIFAAFQQHAPQVLAGERPGKPSEPGGLTEALRSFLSKGYKNDPRDETRYVNSNGLLVLLGEHDGVGTGSSSSSSLGVGG
jgi:hypothetical protein